MNQRENARGPVAALEGSVPPWGKVRVIRGVAANLRQPHTDRFARGALAAIAICPSDAGHAQVTLLSPGPRHRTHGFLRILLRIPDPGHAIAALAHDQAAHLLQQFLLRIQPLNDLIAIHQHAQRPVRRRQVLLRSEVLGEVHHIAAEARHPGRRRKRDAKIALRPFQLVGLPHPLPRHHLGHELGEVGRQKIRRDHLAFRADRARRLIGQRHFPLRVELQHRIRIKHGKRRVTPDALQHLRALRDVLHEPKELGHLGRLRVRVKLGMQFQRARPAVGIQQGESRLHRAGFGPRGGHRREQVLPLLLPQAREQVLLGDEVPLRAEPEVAAESLVRVDLIGPQVPLEAPQPPSCEGLLHAVFDPVLFLHQPVLGSDVPAMQQHCADIRVIQQVPREDFHETRTARRRLQVQWKAVELPGVARHQRQHPHCQRTIRLGYQVEEQLALHLHRRPAQQRPHRFRGVNDLPGRIQCQQQFRGFIHQMPEPRVRLALSRLQFGLDTTRANEEPENEDR